MSNLTQDKAVMKFPRQYPAQEKCLTAHYMTITEKPSQNDPEPSSWIVFHLLAQPHGTMAFLYRGDSMVGGSVMSQPGHMTKGVFRRDCFSQWALSHSYKQGERESRRKFADKTKEGRFQGLFYFTKTCKSQILRD